jgi:D-glycero-D-manno-heptose 1,7-bisphosphate phosphatase
MKAVLLDRDGVINALVYHHDAGIIDAPFTRAQFEILPRVPEAIRLFNDLGLHVAIVSNQPGIAKGHLKRETLKYFERGILSAVRKAGGRVDHIYYCLHHPDAKVSKLRQNCDCRKPGIAMLQQAASDMRVDLRDCYMIGDGIPDLEAATRAGCRPVFIGRWKCEVCQFTEAPHIRPAIVAKNLWEAAQTIRYEVSKNDFSHVSAPCAVTEA